MILVRPCAHQGRQRGSRGCRTAVPGSARTPSVCAPWIGSRRPRSAASPRIIGGERQVLGAGVEQGEFGRLLHRLADRRVAAR